MSALTDSLRGTVKEILDDHSAVVTIATVGGSLLTNAGAVLFAHFGKKYGLDPGIADQIPRGAAYLSFALVGLVCTHVHAKGKVSVEEAKGAAGIAPVGSGEFKAGLQALAVDAIKAALDQHLPAAIQGALSKPPTTTSVAGTVTVVSAPPAAQG